MSITGAITTNDKSKSELYSGEIAIDGVADSGLAGGGGMIVVYSTTSGVTGLYRLDYHTVVAVSLNALFTVTKDNASTINVYWETDQVKIQNKTAGANTVKLGFFGH